MRDFDIMDLETMGQAFAALRDAVGDAYLYGVECWRCSTCAQCQRDGFGVFGSLGGFHRGIGLDGLQRHVSRKWAEGRGVTGPDAFANLLRALA